MHRGYFALWRKFEDHPFWKEKRVFSKAEAWLDLLWNAQHDENPHQVVMGMKVITCNYGESVKSLETWSRRWGWNKSRVRRFLALLENMGQIRTANEIKTTRITVLNYCQYDPRRNESETKVKRKRNGSETHSTPDKNVKNVKNDNNKDNAETKPRPSIPFKEIIDYLNEKANRSYIHSTKATRGFIRARWNEGFNDISYFKTVVDNMTAAWLTNSEMCQFLRPQTLFGTKFESYLQRPSDNEISDEPVSRMKPSKYVLEHMGIKNV